jgi:3,4-dihydroxy-2-butanone 4-phosphate synthase
VVSYQRGVPKVRLLPDDQIVEMYLSGVDSDTVGNRAGCAAKIVLQLVRAAGGAVRRPGLGAGHKLQLPESEIVQRYGAGESGVRLADAAGCCPASIYSILRKHGVPVRDRNPAAAAAKAKLAKARRAARNANQ